MFSLRQEEHLPKMQIITHELTVLTWKRKAAGECIGTKQSKKWGSSKPDWETHNVFLWTICLLIFKSSWMV